MLGLPVVRMCVQIVLCAVPPGKIPQPVLPSRCSQELEDRLWALWLSSWSWPLENKLVSLTNVHICPSRKTALADKKRTTRLLIRDPP